MSYRINAEIIVRILRSLSAVSKWSYKLRLCSNEYIFIIGDNAASASFQVEEMQFSTQASDPIEIQLPIDFVKFLSETPIRRSAEDVEIVCTELEARIEFLGSVFDTTIEPSQETPRWRTIELFQLSDLIELCGKSVASAEVVVLSPHGSVALAQNNAEAVFDRSLAASRWWSVPNPLLLRAAFSKLVIESSHISDLGIFGNLKLSAKSKLPSIAYGYGSLTQLDHRERHLNLYRQLTQIQEQGKKLPLDAGKLNRAIDRLKAENADVTALTRTTRIQSREFAMLFGSIQETTSAYLLDNLLLVSDGRYDRLHTVSVLQPVRQTTEMAESPS
jgi:hypothetical protein